MKKIILMLIVLTTLSCRSVDNWQENPVLANGVVTQAQIYLTQQDKYNDLLENRVSNDIKDNLSISELDNQLKIEKEIALSSQRVLNSWFDFYLMLRQDSGFNRAYKGHFYFRKAITALSYGDKASRSKIDTTLKDNQLYEEISDIEGQCRMAIAEIVAYNQTEIETDILYKNLKKLYKIIN